MSGKKKQYPELSTLIDYLRSKGVVSYKGEYLGGAVELVLLADAPVKLPKEEKPSKDAQVEKRRGADGLTAAEQFERYNRVLDAEE